VNLEVEAPKDLCEDAGKYVSRYYYVILVASYPEKTCPHPIHETLLHDRDQDTPPQRTDSGPNRSGNDSRSPGKQASECSPDAATIVANAVLYTPYISWI
jgi:hypothetical protein